MTSTIAALAILAGLLRAKPRVIDRIGKTEAVGDIFYRLLKPFYFGYQLQIIVLEIIEISGQPIVETYLLSDFVDQFFIIGLADKPLKIAGERIEANRILVHTLPEFAADLRPVIKASCILSKRARERLSRGRSCYKQKEVQPKPRRPHLPLSMSRKLAECRRKPLEIKLVGCNMGEIGYLAVSGSLGNGPEQGPIHSTGPYLGRESHRTADRTHGTSDISPVVHRPIASEEGWREMGSGSHADH